MSLHVTTRTVSRETRCVLTVACSVFLLSLNACEEQPVAATTAADHDAPSIAVGPSARLQASSDARELSAELRAAAVHKDPALRELAVELLGRLENEAALPMLELALADREPGIRLDAARGLARHPAQSAALREAQVLGAYAVAHESAERAELIGLLADIAPNASSPAFAQAIASVDPIERAAGCLALQRLESRGHRPGAQVLARSVELLSDADARVVEACTSVLAEPVARETLPEPARVAATHELARLTRSAAPDAALPAIAALASMAGRDALAFLEPLAGSREPRIALESVRTLARIAPPATLAALAARELDHLAAQPGSASSDREAHPGSVLVGRGRVLLELMKGLEQRPDQTEAQEIAVKALKRMGPPAASAERRAQLERAVLHCAAARLADAARHWPKELFECGHGAMPEALRDVWTAQAFGQVDDSDELRAVQLARLFEKGPRAVRIAVLAATATLPVKQAVAQLKLGLRDADPLVLAAAASAIGSRPGLRQADEASRLQTFELVEPASRIGESPEAALAWLRAARVVGRASAAAHEPIKEASGSTEHAEPEHAKTRAGSALLPMDRGLIERVTQLARHPSRAVREPARALLSEWEAPTPVEIDRVATALPADRVPDAASLFHVKLETTQGLIELELDTARAPISAVRFIQLARSGALDGLAVADLSAGRAVAFAPTPSAESPSLRHEDTPGEVGRGSVLLQDHGRDAVGPGFALILARAPSLDRRAVRLGTITAGLEIADALSPADSILEAQVSIGRR